MKFATVLMSLVFVGFAAQANDPATDAHNETTTTTTTQETHMNQPAHSDKTVSKKTAKKGAKTTKEVKKTEETTHSN